MAKKGLRFKAKPRERNPGTTVAGTLKKLAIESPTGVLVGRALTSKGRAVSKLADKSRVKTAARKAAKAWDRTGRPIPRDTMRRPPTEGPFYKKTKFKMKLRPGPDFEVVRPTLVDVKKKRKKKAGRRVRR